MYNAIGMILQYTDAILQLFTHSLIMLIDRSIFLAQII